MTCAQMVALQRAQRIVADVRTVLTIRGNAPPVIHRGYCLDCDAAVELSRDHVCFCGSRSVMPSRGRRVA